MTSHREEVPAALAGERLDRIVAMATGRSRGEAAALVAAGAVAVDGQVRRSGKERLPEGAEVVIDLPELASAQVLPDPTVEVPVVHADDAVVVVDKPAGLVVHPGAGNAERTLVHGLLARFPEIAAVGEPERPGIVHRLDKGTSGLLVVARTEAARRHLVDQLARRAVERTYLVLVQGVPEATSGIVDAPIGRSARAPTRMAVSERGRDAKTRYEVAASWDDPGRALLRCRLETGRTHQIRVHLAAIGHPVVADTRYGGTPGELGLDRPFLHATRLAFDHPVTGRRAAFESPPPSDLAAALAALGPSR